MLRLFCVLLCIVVGSFAVQAVNAETQSQRDWWGGDVDQGAPMEEFYWLAPTDQTIVYQRVSLDAAIPIELAFFDLQTNNERLNEALTFVHITASAVTANGDGPAISGRLFRIPDVSWFPGANVLLGWQPDQILEPDTTYRITLIADNEGLWLANDLDPSQFVGARAPSGNVSNELSIVTASRILPLAPLPIIDNIQVGTKAYFTGFFCPEGQTLCDAPNNCYDRIDYHKFYPYIKIDLRDNEEDGEEIFLEYLIRVLPYGENELPQRILDIWKGQHTVYVHFLMPADDFEAHDSYCFDLIVRDLRSYAVDQEEAEEQVSTRCVDGSFFVPSPTYESLANQCHPIDNIPQPDADNTPDATDITDATDAGADADILPTDPSDEDACSCQNLRTARSYNGFSILWMISLAVVFRFFPFFRLFAQKQDKT